MSLTTERPGGDEIVSTRAFAAPREAIFRAFTDPAVLARWWGPKGFTNTFHTFDPRPGGAWQFVMHAPDGIDYHNESEFIEVNHGRIVFRHLKPIHRFQMEITLADEDGGTRVTWRMRFETAEEADRVRAFAGPANEENLDRLQAVLVVGDS